MASDDVLRALGIPDLPDFEYQRVRKKILTSAIVFDRVMYDLVAQHAPRIILGMHELERKALRASVGHPEAAPASARWTIREFVTTGQPYLHVTCDRCRQDASFLRPEAGADQVTKNSQGDITSRFSPPLYVDQVRAVLDGIAWRHCGVLSQPPVDLLLTVEQSWMRGAEERSRKAARREDD